MTPAAIAAAISDGFEVAQAIAGRFGSKGSPRRISPTIVE